MCFGEEDLEILLDALNGGRGVCRCDNKLKDTRLLKFKWVERIVSTKGVSPGEDYLNKEVGEVVDYYLLCLELFRQG